MSVDFVKDIADTEVQYSVIKTLRAVMAGNEQPRSWEEIHASDLTKEDFCPRRVALFDRLKRKRRPSYVPSALRATYDMGNSTADLVRERWLGDKAWGNWECLICGKRLSMAARPVDEGCPGNAHNQPLNHFWRYREIKFESQVHGFTGSVDLLVNLGAPRLYLVELKIMAPEQFKRIVAPLAEHRLRTNLYLRLIEESGSAYGAQINLHRAVVLYVSRGYGTKNEEHATSILPFKEYWVKRDDQHLGDLLDMSKAVKDYRDVGRMPYGVCPTATCKIARFCQVQKECFGAQFPPSS